MKESRSTESTNKKLRIHANTSSSQKEIKWHSVVTQEWHEKESPWHVKQVFNNVDCFNPSYCSKYISKTHYWSCTGSTARSAGGQALHPPITHNVTDGRGLSGGWVISLGGHIIQIALYLPGPRSSGGLWQPSSHCCCFSLNTTTFSPCLMFNT